jgi:uncharacterized protein (DUF1778 family)
MESKKISAVIDPIDEKLSDEQKEFFRYAASLGGFANLGDFLIFSALEKALQIINTHNSFLASNKDREVFFDALTNPAMPNKTLYDASKVYQNYVNEK